MMKYLIALFAVVALAALAYGQQVAGPVSLNGLACAYNSVLPTITTNNAGWVQCDSTGHLLISGTINTVSKPANGTGDYSAATAGVADATVLAASTATVFLDLVNESPSATICVNLGAAATITGSTCAAGEIALPPLWHRSWENSFVPTDAIHAIASAAATPMTVGVK